MKIKWGILGAGWIADKFVADFKLVDNGEVVAIASRSLEKAEALASKFNIPKAYGSYKELVLDKDIDIIYVATTHNFHFEHTKLCLNNGKHVLCEKPVTVSAAQFNKLAAQAHKANLFYMEAMWTPFLPAVKKAVEWVNEGKIGEIKVIQANFGFPAKPEFKERLFNPNLAGGALLDVGIYPLTIIEMFANSKINNFRCHSTFTDTGVDETLMVQLEYKNNIKAQLATSISTFLKNDAFICGTKGFIQIKDFWMSKSATLTTNEKTETYNDPTETMGYNWETVAVNDDLLNGRIEDEVMTQARSRKMMLLMDSIRAKIGLKYPFE